MLLEAEDLRARAVRAVELRKANAQAAAAAAEARAASQASAVAASIGGGSSYRSATGKAPVRAATGVPKRL